MRHKRSSKCSGIQEKVVLVVIMKASNKHVSPRLALSVEHHEGHGFKSPIGRACNFFFNSLFIIVARSTFYSSTTF